MLLLKTLAAVAPVPRQDDFGIDAVATLLRKGHMDRCWYAEESFYVQFKSVGKRPIVYRDHEIGWLKGLQLPFFIGTVDKKASRLDLFPAHGLNELFVSLLQFNEVKVRMGTRGDKKRRFDDHSLEIFLGPPLLSFAMGDVSEAKFAARAYRLLKDFLRLEQRNVATRHTRFVTHLSWTTNENVKITGSAHTLSKARQKEELHHACETIVPGLRLAEMYAEAVDDKELGKAIANLTGRLKRVFAEKEYLDEEKTSYTHWPDPFDTLS